MTNKIAAVAVLMLIADCALAQPGASAPEPLEGKASVGYLATSGNSESTNANAAFNLVLNRDWTHRFDLSAIGATSSGETTTEAYAAAYKGSHDINEKSYFFGALNWERDRFSSYEQKLSEAIGYGRHIVATESHRLDVDFGVGARQQDLVDGTRNDSAIARAGLDYRWTVNETTSFSQKLLVESGSSNTNVQTATELRARLFGNIALLLSYRIKYNSEVLPGSVNSDRFTAISLEYQF